MDKQRILLLLALIIIIGIILRAYNLGLRDYQMDELFIKNYGQAKLSDTISVYTNMRYEKPPLFYLLLHFWKAGFGAGEVAMRSFSVLFGILSIPFAYLIGRRIFSERVGLLSSLLVSVSPAYVFVSQDLKVFSLLAFLFMVSAYSLVRAIQEKDNRFWIAFIVATLLTLYTNYIAIYFVIILNAIVFLVYRKKELFKKWILSQVSIGILFLPLLVYTIQRIKYMEKTFVTASGLMPGNVYAIGFAGIGKNIYNIIGALVQINFGAFLNFSLVKSYALIVVPVLIVLTYLLWKGWESSERVRRESLIGVLILALILFSIHGYFSIIGIPLDVKHTVPFALGYFILLAKGISLFEDKRVFYSALTFVLVLCIACNFVQYPYGEEDWKGINSYIGENSQAGDIVLIYPNWISLGFDEYYTGNLPVKEIPEDYPDFIDYRPSDVVYMTEENIGTVGEATQGYNRVWYVVRKRETYEPYNLVNEWLGENGELIEEKQIKSIEVFLYELGSTTSACERCSGA